MTEKSLFLKQKLKLRLVLQIIFSLYDLHYSISISYENCKGILLNFNNYYNNFHINSYFYLFFCKIAKSKKSPSEYPKVIFLFYYFLATLIVTISNGSTVRVTELFSTSSSSRLFSSISQSHAFFTSNPKDTVGLDLML